MITGNREESSTAKGINNFITLHTPCGSRACCSPRDSSCAKVVFQLRSSCFKITKSEVNFELLLNAVRSFKRRADASLRGPNTPHTYTGRVLPEGGLFPLFFFHYLFLSVGCSVPPRGRAGIRGGFRVATRLSLPPLTGIAPLPVPRAPLLPSRLLPAAPSPPASSCCPHIPTHRPCPP